MRKDSRISMLKNEWRHVREHPLLTAALSVMLLIPIMYAGFFLGSIWNPYGNTKNLPVAIVNEDTGAEISGTRTVLGDEIVDTLKGNTDMGWHFVSADQAAAGIKNGNYYMELVIPADFSANAASVTEPNPKQAVLTYTLTPSKNFIASLLTEQAAKGIEQTVTRTINKAYVSALLSGLQSAGSGMATASNGAAELASGSSQLQNGISQYTNGVGQLMQGQTTLTSGLSSLHTGAASLQSGVSSLSGQLPTSAQITQLTNGVAQIKQGISQLNTAVSTPDPALASAQIALGNDAVSLQQLLTTYATEAAASTGSLTNLTIAAESGGPTVTVNTSDLAAALTLLNTSQQITQKSASLLNNLNTVTTLLSGQQTQLAASVAALQDGMTTLAPNLTAALNGYSGLTTGTSRLLAGTTQLNSGLVTAYSGSQQVLSGLQALDANSSTLRSGTAQLNDGAQTLTVGLADGSQKLAVQPTSADTLAQIVAPLTLQKSTTSDVPNYGYALSPYVLSLGLFVGALVFNVIYPVRRVFGDPDSARSWWLSKMSVAFAVSVGQALVLCAVMVFGLGLHPDNPGLFVLLSIITSITFMSIITLLVMALDNIGRFLAMLLLVLQLGSSEGVFPIVLSSSFFQIMNPWLPMTYAIRAFREAISSGLGLSVYWQNVAVLVLFTLVGNAGLILFLRLHGKRHFGHESIEE